MRETPPLSESGGEYARGRWLLYSFFFILYPIHVKTYFLHILGCAMNYADAERIESVLAATGWAQAADADEADLYLFVTCSVKQKAEDKVFGFLRDLSKWKEQKPGRQVGLTGCMARLSSNRDSAKQDALLSRGASLDFVFRIEDTAQLPDLLGGELKASAPEDAEYYRRYLNLDPKRKNTFQALVPISKGCDNFCSFCIVPTTRGREISRPAEEVLAECEKAIANGAVEISLLGQNVDSYQKSSAAFAELLDSVAQLPGLQRLRFTSSHPKDTVEAVMDVMAANPNIERHLHFAAQHGDDEVLQKMNRGYTAAEFLEKVKLFRQKVPGASVTTDIIIGFPGETEAAFDHLKRFYRDAAFEFAFISRYSPRPGTISAEQMTDDVPREVKAARWNEMNEILKEITSARYAALQGQIVNVLVESCEAGVCAGRSSEMFLVKFPGDAALVGSIVSVKIKLPRTVELIGELEK